MLIPSRVKTGHSDSIDTHSLFSLGLSQTTQKVLLTTNSEFVFTNYRSFEAKGKKHIVYIVLVFLTSAAAVG